MKKYLVKVSYPNGHNFICEARGRSVSEVESVVRNAYRDECSNPTIEVVKVIKGG